jgi:hypothetical protein
MTFYKGCGNRFRNLAEDTQTIDKNSPISKQKSAVEKKKTLENQGLF